MSHTSVIFNVLCHHLAADPDRTARVAFGPACEQWISSEAFVALNWSVSPLPVGRFVLCESRKRDITLFDGDDENRIALATIEAKVVHPNKNLEGQLLTLFGQLKTISLPDETEATERGAIVYAVWSDWWRRRDTRSEEMFHRVVETKFRTLFNESEHNIAPLEGLQPIIECRTVSWLEQDYKVSIYGICAVRRPRR